MDFLSRYGKSVSITTVDNPLLPYSPGDIIEVSDMATASMASAAGLAAYQQKSQMLSNPTYLPPQPSEIVYTLNIEFLDGSTDIITDIRDVGVTDGYVWYVTKGDLDSTDYIPLTSIKRYRRSMTTI